MSGGRVLFDIRRRPKGQVGTILLSRAYFQFHTGNVALFPIFSDNLLDRATHCGLRSPFCVFFYSANTLFLRLTEFFFRVCSPSGTCVKLCMCYKKKMLEFLGLSALVGGVIAVVKNKKKKGCGCDD
uniref:Transmembrane protein n=1 Tax=Myoviridae sp. ctwVB15 TaxID=2825208 RepID=A0A8S5UNI1_9CAUD|nr:MAG TPA: hypothetical protein [Myoviridae sp. ctwVB15]